jgi:WD40 repeat protein
VSVAFAPTGTRLAIAEGRGVVVFDSPGGDIQVAYPEISSFKSRLIWSPNGDWLAVTDGSVLHLVSGSEVRRLRKIKTGIGSILALAVSPDGKTLLAGGRPGSVEVYDVDSLTLRTTFDFDIGVVHALAFAPDGATFAVGGDGGLLVCDAG